MKKRTEQFGMLLSGPEKEALRLLAEVEGGLSQAALLRRLIRREARRAGVLPLVATEGKARLEVDHA